VPAIKVKNLSKTFKDFKAVSGIDFEVPENKVVGFLGPNGAGKTTTIRMIVGLSKPTDGEIEVNGEKVVFGDFGANKSFSYLPELPSFYGWMSGKEYLDYIAQIFGIDIKTRKKKIAELLKLVNLADFANRKIAAYSNGMKQRLGIAQALINDPKVLIMDEPVSSLDPIGRREILRIIEELKKKMTIFLSTHILSDVDKICDEIIIINKGKIAINSTLADLKEKYAKSILEVEFSGDSNGIEDKLKAENWIKKYEKNGNNIKIWLSDENVMQKNIPLKFFASQNIAVIKYGIKMPEVEDLFIDLIKEKK
jgi:ABC-2 type transport system ATP-binding protein